MTIMRRPLILLVEDNAGDAQLVTEALVEIGADIEMDIAGDGEDGLRRLIALEASGHLPDLIILNFNLPKMTGAELLTRLRANPILARIPTIMLTSSDRDSDHAACSGVQDYLIKSTTWDDTLGIARRIVEILKRFSEVGKTSLATEGVPSHPGSESGGSAPQTGNCREFPSPRP